MQSESRPDARLPPDQPANPELVNPWDVLRARDVLLIEIIIVAVLFQVLMSSGIVRAIGADWASCVLYAATVPTLVWWCQSHGVTLSDLFGRRPRVASLLVGGAMPAVAAWGIAAVVLLLIALSSYVAPAAALRLLNHPPLGQITAHTWTVARVLLTIVVAPVVEELVFRGVLMRRWVHKWGLWRGVAMSSIVFAALNGYDAPLTFVPGVMYALLFVTTGSLWAPIAGHAVYNALETAIHVAGTSSDAWTLPEMRASAATWLAIATACALVLYLLRSSWLPGPTEFAGD